MAGRTCWEPAYWAKPVICGPHMENFPFVKEFYEKGAAIEVDESGLFNKLKELLQSPEKEMPPAIRLKNYIMKKQGQ